MKLIEELNPRVNLIRSYEDGAINLANKTFRSNLMVFPDRLIADWTQVEASALVIENLEAAVAYQPEILVLGTGDRHLFPKPEIMAVLSQQRIGFEVMTTAAACRTYNVLVAENRRVVAALFL